MEALVLVDGAGLNPVLDVLLLLVLLDACIDDDGAVCIDDDGAGLNAVLDLLLAMLLLVLLGGLRITVIELRLPVGLLLVILLLGGVLLDGLRS